MIDVQIAVLAKAPVPGRVKTRLCPPLAPQQAADVARAALLDTLSAVGAVAVRRRLLVLDGDSKGLVPQGFSVLPQRGGGLDERLACAFSDAFATAPWPVLLVGMDTPQVTAVQLAAAASVLATGRSVLGHAEDGGWWAAGLTAPDPYVFLGVAMSSSLTGRMQEQRMHDRGLTPALLPVLRDIDDVDDLVHVGCALPRTARLAQVLTTLDLDERVA